jgi:hypothetical protein
MTNNFKDTQDTLRGIEFLKDRHSYFAKEFIRLAGEKTYQKSLDFYDDIMAKLKQELQTLPMGRRYSGTFYIRKPYTVPIQFEKIEGSAFIREDLVSWKIEPKDKSKEQFYGYHRVIYKKPDLNTEIKKEEAKLVYLEKPQIIEAEVI